MADKQWEYATDELKTGILSPEILNEWGLRGWELVALVDQRPIFIWLVFKREKAPDYQFVKGPLLTLMNLETGAPGAQRPEPASGEGTK